MSMKMIVIGRDFSDAPAGRTPADGPFSGERFRDEILVPALKENDKVVVDISEIEGVGSSFLEETFGGMIRLGIFTFEELSAKLEVKTSDPLFEMCPPRVQKYMRDAKEDLKKKVVKQ